MSIFLGELTKVADNKYHVGLQHKSPDTLSNEIKATGFIIEELPIMERIEGKDEVLYYNPATEEVWYEYEIPAISPSDEIAMLKAENKTLKENQDMIMGVINEMLLGGGV
jgi:hypothetical protein